MSTNYYIKADDLLEGPYDDLYDEWADEDGLHLGKRSSGWGFSLRVYPEYGFCSFADMETLIDELEQIYKGRIYDEYGTKISTEYFLDTVKDWGKNQKVTLESFKKHQRQSPFSSDFYYDYRGCMMHTVGKGISCGRHFYHPISYIDKEFS